MAALVSSKAENCWPFAPGPHAQCCFFFAQFRDARAWLQFIYDMWYGSLTPDKEFPREVRRVLNTAFGELAARARKTDLKGMLLRLVHHQKGWQVGACVISGF